MTIDEDSEIVANYEARAPLQLPIEAIEDTVSECIESLLPEDCERIFNRYLREPDFKDVLVGAITKISFIATAAGQVAETDDSFARLILADMFDTEDPDIKLVTNNHINTLMVTDNLIISVNGEVYKNRMKQLKVVLSDI